MPLLSAEKGVSGRQGNLCPVIPKATATAAAAATTTYGSNPSQLKVEARYTYSKSLLNNEF